MPSPKSGQENPIKPPDDPLEADEANPGKNAEILEKKKKAEKEKENQQKADDEEENKEPPKTWVEFKLIDAAGKPVKGEKCTLTLEDGNKIIKNKKTDANGKIRIDNIKPGSTYIQLVDRYDYEWVLDLDSLLEKAL